MPTLLAYEDITIERGGEGTTFDTVTGLPVAGTVTTFTEKGNVQPLTGKDLQQVPEGERELEQLIIYTKFQLQNADVVVRDLNGKRCKVLRVEQWNSKTGKVAHFRARAAVID